MKKLVVFLTLFIFAPAVAFPENQPGGTSSDGGTSSALDFANGLYARKMYAPAVSEYEKFIKAYPHSPEVASARFRYADSCYFMKNYQEAVSQFESFIVDFPKDGRVPMALFRVGTARYYMNEIAPAARVFSKIIASMPDPTIKSGALFYLSKCYDARKKTEKALQILTRLVKEFPSSEYAAYAGLAVGDHALALNRYEDAAAAYQVAADKNYPAELAREALFKMAEIYFSRKEYGRAQTYYLKLLQRTSEPGDLSDAGKRRNAELKDKALLGLFYCDYSLHDLNAAQKRWELQSPAIASSAYKGEIIYLLAVLFADAKKYDLAVQRLDEVLSDASANEILKEKAHFKKAALLALQNKKDISLQEIEKLLQANSSNLGRAYFEKAEILKALNRDAEALDNYKVVIEKYAATQEAKAALYQSAFLYLKAGDRPKARKYLSAFTDHYASDPNTETALLQIIQIDMDSKDFKAAAQGTWSFIRSFPKSSYSDIAYYKLGVSLTGLRRYKHGALAFEKLLARFPSSKLQVESLYGAAVDWENAGDAPRSLAHYEKLVYNYPRHKLAEESLVRMAYLYIQTKNYPKLNAVYQELLFHRPNVKMESDGVFWLVRWLLNQGDTAAAKKILGILPKRFPEKNLQHEINFFLGESAMGLKDTAAAVDFYNKAIQSKKDGAYVPEAYLGMGLAYAARNDDVSAEKNYNEVLRYDYATRATLRARFEIAGLRLKTGRFEEAAKGYMLIAILYDDAKYTPLSLYRAAECFKKLNQTDEANKALQELKNRYPKEAKNV